MSFYREIDGTILRTYTLTAPVERFRTARGTVEFVPTEEFGLTLFIDNELQFAQRDEYIYHEMLVHPAIATARERTNVCIIGGGDGLALREVLKWDDVDHVDLIDWDEELMFLFTTTYSALNQQSILHPRCMHDARDIRECLHETRQYQVLIIDLVDPNHREGECINLWEDLLSGVRRWLAPGGSLVLNAGGFYPWDTETLRWLLQRLAAVFRDLQGYSIQAYKVFVPSFAREWCFFLVSPSPTLRDLDNTNLRLPNQLRYFNKNTWSIAHTWPDTFVRDLPTEPVNLNTYFPAM